MSRFEFENESKREDYKTEAICDNKINTKESYSDHLLDFYCLILWNGYLEKKNI